MRLDHAPEKCDSADELSQEKVVLDGGSHSYFTPFIGMYPTLGRIAERAKASSV
jgi:hypothetical protein